MTYDPRQGGSKRRTGGLVALAAFALIPAGLIVLPTTLLVLVGLLPTVVAYVIDDDPEKSAPITVGAMNFCGVMPFAIKLWQDGHSVSVVLVQLTDPLTWFIMYGAAGVGWLVYYGLPPMIAGVVVMRDEARIKALDDERRAIVAQWGPDIVAKAEPPEADAGETPAGG